MSECKTVPPGRYVLVTAGPVFTEEMWRLACCALQDAFSATLKPVKVSRSEAVSAGENKVATSVLRPRLCDPVGSTAGPGAVRAQQTTAVLLPRTCWAASTAAPRASAGKAAR